VTARARPAMTELPETFDAEGVGSGFVTDVS
jgi:hypothetical protein